MPDNAPADADCLTLALDWYRAGKGAALVTVMQTWGSSPWPPGSRMVVAGQGDFAGAIAGGCVEAEVVLSAQQAITAGQCEILTFGVADETAFAAGLACGGTIRLLVEPLGEAPPLLHPDLVADLVAMQTARTPFALEVDSVTWSRRVLQPGWSDDAEDRFRTGKSGVNDDGRFLAMQTPTLRLIVVGAVHVARPLVAMARLAGYAVSLIDPRSAYGSAQRFPDDAVLIDDADQAMRGLGLDSHTAVVTLSHEARIDDPALEAALRSEVFYIGALGSRRTHAGRLERLRQKGWCDADLARIHGPAGLDLGSVTPAEVALSILAEMTKTLRQDGVRLPDPAATTQTAAVV